MARKPPPSPTALEASAEWVAEEFGVHERPASALRQLERCLDELASYEHRFLMTMATLAEHTGDDRRLAYVADYASKKWPDDAEAKLVCAKMFLRRRRYKKAERLAREAIGNIKRREANAPMVRERARMLRVECFVRMRNKPAAMKIATQLEKSMIMSGVL